MSEHIRHDLDLLQRSLLDGKLPRNLSWNEALDLIQHLGTAEPHGSDEFAFVVGTHKAFFRKPHTPELGVEEVSRLRKFLKEAGPKRDTSNATQPHRVIVVIDHHAARVYQDVVAAARRMNSRFSLTTHSIFTTISSTAKKRTTAGNDPA